VETLLKEVLGDTEQLTGKINGANGVDCNGHSNGHSAGADADDGSPEVHTNGGTCNGHTTNGNGTNGYQSEKVYLNFF
jgi:hypothetical protein